jgi:hypothetical protein
MPSSGQRSGCRTDQPPPGVACSIRTAADFRVIRRRVLIPAALENRAGRLPREGGERKPPSAGVAKGERHVIINHIVVGIGSTRAWRKRTKRLAISIGHTRAANVLEQGLDLRAFNAVRTHQCAGPRIRQYFAKRRLVFSPNRHVHTLFTVHFNLHPSAAIGVQSCPSQGVATSLTTASAHFMPRASACPATSTPRVIPSTSITCMSVMPRKPNMCLR